MAIRTTDDTDFLWDTRKLQELNANTEVVITIGNKDTGKEHKCLCYYRGDMIGWDIFPPDNIKLTQQEVANIGDELEMLRLGTDGMIARVDRENQKVTDTKVRTKRK